MKLIDSRGTVHTLPSTARLVELTTPMRLATNQVPGRPGAVVSGGWSTHDSRRIALQIVYPASTRLAAETWRRQISSIFAFSPVQLYRHDDYNDYISVYQRDIHVAPVVHSGSRIIVVNLDLVAHDPYFYSATEVTDSAPITGWQTTWTVDNTGQVALRPVIEVYGRGDTQTTAALEDPVITNTTTGESIAYSGQLAAGDVLRIDATNYTARVNGTSVLDQISGLTAGFWVLPGANAFALDARFAGLKVHAADALLAVGDVAVQTLVHSTDAVFALTDNVPAGKRYRPHYADAVLQARRRGVLEHASDAVLNNVPKTLEHHTDAFLRSQVDSSVAVIYRPQWL